MENPLCETCKHWQHVNDKGQGQCRLNPPVTHIIPHQGLQGMELSIQSIFPPADANSWCSQHSDHSSLPRLTWTKDEGFNRAPTLEEAAAFSLAG